MKKIILLTVLLTTFLNYGQDISMIKSEIFKDSKKNSSLVFSLEDDHGGLITIRAFYGGLTQNIKGYYVEHFDKELKLLKEVEYEVKLNRIKNAFIKNNQLHLIEYEYDRKADKIRFNAVSADVNDLNFSKKEILSLSEDEQRQNFGFVMFPISIGNFAQFDDNYFGEVVFSSGKRYFVINFDGNNSDKETHKIFVFNNDFEKVYDQVIQKDIKDKYFEYNSVDIDDQDGTVYFLGKSFENESRRSKKDGKTNYHFELYKVNASGQEYISFKNEDKFISSLELLKSGDRLACVGFYGNTAEGKINGVCLFDLDPQNLKMKMEKFNPFSEEFLTDKYGNKEGKKERKKKKGIKNIDFKGVYLMGNGDIVINAEEYYITTHTTMNPNGGMTSYTVYHFDDIMSIRMDKEGAVKWARNINKRQTGFTTSSYTSLPVGDNSYFFINCSDKINQLSADRISFRQTSAKRSNLYVIKIDNEGNFNFNKLIDDKDSEVYYKVNNGNININNQTVILTGKKKKKTRILKLKV